jgi:hypothetical protein
MPALTNVYTDMAEHTLSAVTTESRQGMKYSALISYSGRDRAWVEWIHKALESYTVPKGMAVPAAVPLRASRRLQQPDIDRTPVKVAASATRRLFRKFPRLFGFLPGIEAR